MVGVIAVCFFLFWITFSFMFGPRVPSSRRATLPPMAFASRSPARDRHSQKGGNEIVASVLGTFQEDQSNDTSHDSLSRSALVAGCRQYPLSGGRIRASLQASAAIFDRIYLKSFRAILTVDGLRAG